MGLIGRRLTAPTAAHEWMVNDMRNMSRPEAFWVLNEMLGDATEDQKEALRIAQYDIEFVDLMQDDMVAVVRCADCKHYHDFETHYDCNHICGMDDVRPTDYCSYGERKDGEG